MGLFENIKLATTNLLGNKLRSILTMLGIIIGISSVITIVTIGDSLASSITGEVSGFGARNISVYLDQKNNHIEDDDNENEINYDELEYVEPTEKDNITDEMLSEYKMALGSEIQDISISENIGSNNLINGKNSANINIFGVNNGYFKVENIKLLTGRFINDKDIKDLRNLIVVSDEFIDDYFGKQVTYEESLGKSLEINIGNNTVRVYICGVYQFDKSKSANENLGSEKLPTSLYMPISVAKKFNDSENGYKSLIILPSDDAIVEDVVYKTNNFCANKYRENK